MMTSTKALTRYGKPELEAAMMVWHVPPECQVGAVPRRIYCNKDVVKPLERALRCVVQKGLGDKIKTWDGCFNIRRKRAGSSPSLHSWGLAIDINASWNRMGQKPTQDPELVECFTDNGFDWGGQWQNPDGMHFQLCEFVKQ
jgi:hypothetical protein